MYCIKLNYSAFVFGRILSIVRTNYIISKIFFKLYKKAVVEGFKSNYINGKNFFLYKKDLHIIKGVFLYIHAFIVFKSNYLYFNNFFL